ncbi:hypothetical protein [Streptomyces scabiei]|uniref:hypothetical protein n=1 Tax=Streptomyces scabiei TaxID=1930 RepID=UPI001B3333E4|nr:hypothetical protein [Streptomyces sp. LBUM 1488]MBP5898007.1 hypothetical protein [Streptomyces sp. LBUM 1488]
MGSFFEELAKKLAERWVTLLVLPGALFTAAVWVGAQLGYRHAWDWSQLNRDVSHAAKTIAHQAGGTQAGLLIVMLLAATGTGLAVQALAGLTRLIWLGQWPRLLAPLQRWRVTSRNTRWHTRVGQRRELEQAHPSQSRTPSQQHEINSAADQVNRIALAEPGRPTWMGDRIYAVEQIALNRYGLDLAFAWPRLWLVFPEATRTEITTAHAAFAAAVATGTWAWPYLLLGTLWWPAMLAGIGIGITGWARARSAISDLTALSESALDLHGRALAAALGVAEPDAEGPLTIPEGERLTTLLRKGR